MSLARRRFVVIALAVPAAIALAGPLDPPAGPIAPTPGPEPRIAINAVNTPGDADSLFKITQPGSYYLPGNITGVSDKTGIEIAASDVTIDLAGFVLSGVPGSRDGIEVDNAGVRRVAIRDGAIQGWGWNGLNLFQAVGSTIRNVRVADSIAHGMLVAGSTAVIDCTAVGNGGQGIQTANGCIITGCIANSNGGTGIDVATGVTVAHCTAGFNTFHGFSAGNACTFTGCTANNNDLDGFQLTSACTIIGCSSYSNDGAGFDASASCTFAHNSSRTNGADGIRAGTTSVLTFNVCSNNGQSVSGAGIHLTSSDARLEGNTCTGQDVGVLVDLGGNIIIRNVCSGNAVNWNIAANNVFGPIVNRSAPASAAVNGDSAASTLGSTDANANYTY